MSHLLVGDPPTVDLAQKTGQTLGIRHLASGPAEIVLRDVAVQVFAGNVVVGSVHASFQLAKERLQPVRRESVAHVLTSGVVDLLTWL